MDPVELALVDSAVQWAVTVELARSRESLAASQVAWWDGSRAEVQRLNALVTEQARRIAELEGRLAQLQDELSRVDLDDLVRSVTQSIAETARGLDGYAVATAEVEVKAAVRLAAGRMLLTADPGGLLEPDALSTVRLSVRALPASLSAPGDGG